MTRFTENLELLLQQHHMTRTELADKIGVNKSTVTAWFKRNSDVHLGTAIAICDLFNITLDELAKGEISVKTDTFTADEIAQLKKLLNHADEILKEG